MNRFACLFVSDSRIQDNVPDILIRLVPEKSFPLFGRGKRIRWMPGEKLNRARGFSQHVADVRNGDPVVMLWVVSSGLVDFRVSTGPDLGGWAMAEHEEETEWSVPLWNCYQAVARASLAIPLPAKE